MEWVITDPLDIAILAFVTMLLTAVGIRVSETMAMRFGVLVDHPDRLGADGVIARKMHDRPTPLVGGIVMLSLLLPCLLLISWPSNPPWSLAFGLISTALLGILDDHFDIPAAYRLVGQFAIAAIVVIVGGVQVISLGEFPGLGPLELGLLSMPFSILCIVFMINAVNMMDGLDGLAGGILLIAAVGFAVLSAYQGSEGMFLFCALLSSALSGFLLFNMRFPWSPKARVFLGDGGSMMLGFVVAWLAIMLSMPAAGDEGGTFVPASGAAAPVLALLLLLPAADMCGVFLRRIRLGRNPLRADQEHMHHLLVRAGLTVGATVSLLLMLQLMLVGLALSFFLLDTPVFIQLPIVILLFLTLLAMILGGCRLPAWLRHILNMSFR